jgi:hypothetical protein
MGWVVNATSCRLTPGKRPGTHKGRQDDITLDFKEIELEDVGWVGFGWNTVMNLWIS